jgi:hypothetical protein
MTKEQKARLDELKRESKVKQNLVSAVFGAQQVEFCLSLIDSQQERIDSCLKHHLPLIVERDRFKDRINKLEDGNQYVKEMLSSVNKQWKKETFELKAKLEKCRGVVEFWAGYHEPNCPKGEAWTIPVECNCRARELLKELWGDDDTD